MVAVMMSCISLVLTCTRSYHLAQGVAEMAVRYEGGDDDAGGDERLMMRRMRMM